MSKKRKTPTLKERVEHHERIVAQFEGQCLRRGEFEEAMGDLRKRQESLERIIAGGMVARSTSVSGMQGDAKPELPKCPKCGGLGRSLHCGWRFVPCDCGAKSGLKEPEEPAPTLREKMVAALKASESNPQWFPALMETARICAEVAEEVKGDGRG